MTKKKTRAKRFADLTWNDIEEWAGGKIVSRGKSYQRQDMEALKNWRDEFLTRESQ
ncbi:MAG: hypothetical protein ABIH23_28970 [bacterium]